MIDVEPIQGNAGCCSQIAEELQEALFSARIIRYSRKNWNHKHNDQKAKRNNIGKQFRIDEISTKKGNQINLLTVDQAFVAACYSSIENRKNSTGDDQVVYWIGPIIEGPRTNDLTFFTVFWSQDVRSKRKSFRMQELNGTMPPWVSACSAFLQLA